ncbi:MAG: hypothetical protein Q9223_004979 [Gallowayella weberi]
MTSTTFDEYAAAWMTDSLSYPDSAILLSEGQMQVMSGYLDGQTSAQETAYACTRERFRPGNREDVGFKIFSFLIFMTARHLPGTHEPLVELVAAIAKLPEENRGDSVCNHQRRLGDFESRMRDSWEALERNYKLQKQRFDILVRAASQCVEHARPIVYARHGQDAETGAGVPTATRWAFWKRRFEELSSEEDLEQVTREAAKRGAEVMDKVEKESVSSNQVREPK